MVLIIFVGVFSALFVVPIRSVKADPANDYPSDLASASKDSVVDPWGFTTVNVHRLSLGD